VTISIQGPWRSVSRIFVLTASVAVLAPFGLIGQAHAAKGGQSKAPRVSLSSSQTSVASNSFVTLKWRARNADACTAAGDWSGAKALSGGENVGPLFADSSFTLTCTGTGGEQSRTVNVAVASVPAPDIAFSADPSTVNYFDSTTLNWLVQNATSCTASGDWSGDKALSGSEGSGPLTADGGYELSCIGDGGISLASLTVMVNPPATGSASLSWLPPDTNTDGTALSDLAGYRIKYGTSPGSYSTQIDLPDPGLADHVLEGLSPATYYFVITAYNTAGVESDPSNEASKLIQ